MKRLIIAIGLAAGAAHATEGLNLWSDPEFKKHFLGSYGINSEVEPRVTTEERDVLQKIFPLMGTDLPTARRQVEKAAKTDASALFDFTLGNICFQQDDLPAATAALRQAVAKFPAFRRAHKSLGLVQLRAGQYPEAITALTRSIELGATDGLTFGLLGFAYTTQENFVAAESAYRYAALLQPENFDWKLGLARCMFRQQKHAEAVSLLDELIKRKPERSEFWLLQASAYLGLKEPLKAAENYEFVARAGKATVASQTALGDIYVNQTLYDLAAGAYVRAIQLDPAQKPASAVRAAEILVARGASTQAGTVIAMIKEQLGRNLDDADRRKLLKLEARAAIAAGGGESAKVLEEIVALDPLDGEALLLLGQHYNKQNDPAKALFYYERASSLDAYEGPAKLRQAQVLVAQAKYQEAIPLLRRVQEIKPADDVARYLDQVERIAKARR
ncbi:MAG: Beta-barrel assembly-enhancing protease [Verrucomicrobiae bacterium]|nr:Beta-barrel assembly-enhancing protease [Verrucomicrobiae bacterium]